MKLESFEVISVNNNFGFGNHYIAIGILVEAEGEPRFDKSKIPNQDIC